MAAPRTPFDSVSDTSAAPHSVSPLPAWKTLLLFAFASGTVSAGIYLVIPALQARGLTFLASYLIGFYPPFVALFLLALVLYRLEGNSATWAAFRRRYRLTPVRGRTWFNILGEELLWRGYVLPRQEARLRPLGVAGPRWMWTAMHVFWRWNLLSLGPVTFAIPFVAQRVRSTSVALIAHGIANCIPLLVLVYFILS